VTDETLIFALFRPSSNITGGWLGNELDFARHRSTQKAAAAAGAPKGQFDPFLAKTLKPYSPALMQATTANRHATSGHLASVPGLVQRCACLAADQQHSWIAAEGPPT